MNNKVDNEINRYYEKANPQVLNKCLEFIKNYDEDVNSYDNYRTAIQLSSELISSLFDSRKEFDDRIASEMEKINSAKDDITKEHLINSFNKKYIHLVLDKDAIKALTSLELIYSSYKYPDDK